MTTEIRTNIDLNQNELQNAVVHNIVSLPNTGKKGQIASSDGILYSYNGTQWLNTCLQLATDAQANAGTSEVVAINPKQLSGKANVHSPIFTGTPAVPTAAAGTSTTQAASTEFVMNAVNAAVTSAVIYQGVWNTTNQTDYSALNSYRPIKKGWMFRVTGSGCTIDGVEYREGDNIVFNSNIASGATITTAAIDKEDHTESDDLVRLDSTQTLTNKTIAAGSNTISGLTVSNFASGQIVSTLANNATLPNGQAVTAAISGLQTALTFGTGLTLDGSTVSVDNPFISLAEGSLAVGSAGGVVQELTKGSNGNVLTVVNGAVAWAAPVSDIKKQTFTNPAITPTNGVCTWTIAHTINTKDIIVRIYEVNTGREVIMDKTVTGNAGITINFNSAGNVAAGTYKVVLIG